MQLVQLQGSHETGTISTSLSLSKKFGHIYDTHMRQEERFYATWRQALQFKLGSQQTGIYEEQL